jgi:hypothetical protein
MKFDFILKGFTYHNAEERTAVLNQWLLPTKSQIPRFATYVLDYLNINSRFLYFRHQGKCLMKFID